MTSNKLKLITLTEVCQILKVSKRTAEYWIAAGRLPGGVQVCRTRRWRKDIIDQWILDGCPELAECKSVQTDATQNSHIDGGKNAT